VGITKNHEEIRHLKPLTGPAISKAAPIASAGVLDGAKNSRRALRYHGQFGLRLDVIAFRLDSGRLRRRSRTRTRLDLDA
jgi:hypothetical protein